MIVSALLFFPSSYLCLPTILLACLLTFPVFFPIISP